MLFYLAALAFAVVPASQVPVNSWKAWLEDVAPIMTRLEKQTANHLTTEEDRRRYQESFWKVRDPDPATPVNEFQGEYYRRVEYAGKNLNGRFSDRGKIYLLLGQPLEIKDFGGSDDLVDCQLWSYQNLGPKSPAAFINLLFFRWQNIGDYQIYYPGIHKPVDLLAPYAASRHPSLASAFQTLLGNSAELAQASLSVIPGQGDPDITPSAGTSGVILADIYSLPEKQVETQYLRNFQTPKGRVTVTQSTREFHGKLTWAISRQDDLYFANYAFMPDFIGLKPFAADSQHAELVFYLTAVDAQGQTVFQDNRRLDLKLPKAKLEEIMERKVLFQDFFPIIPGTFSVTLTCINQTSGEFFSQSRELIVAPDRPLILFGFDSHEIGAGQRYQPFSAGRLVIHIDPRGLYAAQDALVGMIECAQAPEIILAAVDGEKKTVAALAPVSSRDELHFYRYELKGLASGNYELQARRSGELLLSQPVFLLPAYMKVKRPYTVEQINATDSPYNSWFISGQEHLNRGEADAAIHFFSKLPAAQLTGRSLPIIARAYYQKGDFARALDLLEKEGVEKDYANLALLANSALELKAFAKACQYLEALRNYGDTAEINRLLAAAYLSQGNARKARSCYEHARQLEVQAQSPPPLPEKTK